MKKILTIIIVLLSVFLIYLGFKDKEIYYFSMGDSLANGINSYNAKDYGYSDYVKESLDVKKYVSYTNNNKRSIDFIKDIEDNVKIDDKTIQNVLIKADIITLSVGMNDLFSNITFNSDFSVNDLYTKFEEVVVDLENLFKLLRTYSKEEIIFIGFYNCLKEYSLNEFFIYANEQLKKICDNYKITYLDIYNEFNNTSYFDNPNSYFPNKDGYKLISNKIIDIINEKNKKNA